MILYCHWHINCGPIHMELGRFGCFLSSWPIWNCKRCGKLLACQMPVVETSSITYFNNKNTERWDALLGEVGGGREAKDSWTLVRVMASSRHVWSIVKSDWNTPWERLWKIHPGFWLYGREISSRILTVLLWSGGARALGWKLADYAGDSSGKTRLTQMISW